MSTTRESMFQRWVTFHTQNPTFYAMFLRFSREALGAGRKNLSVNLIFERIRWETTIATVSGDGYKLNNDYRALYARKLMKDYPEFAGFFRTRELTAVTAEELAWL